MKSGKEAIMANKEQVRRACRRPPRKTPVGPELRFSQTPVIEDFLSSGPFSILLREAERCQDPRYAKEVRRKNKTELGLEKYFVPFEAQSLPGLEEVKEHLRAKYRRNFKPSTLAGTAATLKLFLTFFQQQGKTQVEQLGRQDIEAFVEHEHARGMTPNTVRTRYSYVHAFVVFLIDNGILSPEVIFRPIRIKLPEPLPRAIPPEQIQALLAVLEDPRDRALILVLLRTGMRIGELLSTQMPDVNMPGRSIAIRQASKNITGRVVYLSDDACEALEGWFEVRDERNAFLLYSRHRHTMSYACARAILHKHLKQAGLTGKGYGLHSLRHTFATDMLNAGMRIECLQQMLGHSNLEMTRRYARLTDVTREKEYFQAMEVLQKGVTDGHDQLDSELQAILEEKKLHGTNRKALLERLEAISGMGGRTD
jgi:integrase/recombinase XerD